MLPDTKSSVADESRLSVGSSSYAAIVAVIPRDAIVDGAPMSCAPGAAEFFVLRRGVRPDAKTE